MFSIIEILKDQFKNFNLIRRMSMFEIKSKNRNNILGSSWEVLNLIIQVAIYWFVFSNVMNKDAVTLSDGTEVPYFFWLLTGFILWMFIYKSVIEGSNSIYTRLKIISKATFPKSIVPSYVIASKLFVHLIMLLITILILNFNGFLISINYLGIIYVLISSYFLLLGIALITSTLSTIMRDVHMLVNAFFKMFIYLSPVIWEIGKIEGVLGTLIRLNPFFYLIESYREALFGSGWYFIEHWQYSIYFWCLSLIIFYIGSKLHIRFRKHFIDYY